MNMAVLSLIVAPACVSAQAAPAVDECSKELLLAYFPEPFVTPALKKFNVPQDKWAAITSGLAAKDKDILKTVEEKASKLTPNPFKDRDPAQRQVAVKIFRETLTQVFSDVLKANGITDDKQITAMLDDIQQQKAKNFAQCMEKQKQSLRNQMNSQTPAGAPAENAAPVSAPEKG
jgi:formyltetrahydrofolate synthetase